MVKMAPDLSEGTFFWKIKYLDEQCEYGSEDPSHLSKTTRVLTALLASNY